MLFRLNASFFSRKRCVAEAAKVDFTALQDGILQLRSPTLKHTFPVAQSICNRKLTELSATSMLQAMHFFLREYTYYLTIVALYGRALMQYITKMSLIFAWNCPDYAPTMPRVLPQLCPNYAPTMFRLTTDLPIILEKGTNFNRKYFDERASSE